MALLDRVLAVALAILATSIAFGTLLNGDPFAAPFMFVAGIVPSILLWPSKLQPMLGLFLYSFCCCTGASVACDAGPSDPWQILHVAHDYLWLLAPYSALRLLTFALLNWRSRERIE